MCISCILLQFSEGAFNIASNPSSDILPPVAPVNAIFFAPLSLAFSKALITFSELPEVLIPIRDELRLRNLAKKYSTGRLQNSWKSLMRNY